MRDTRAMDTVHQETEAVYTSWRPLQINALIEPKAIAAGYPQLNEEQRENFFRCAKW